MATNEKDEVRIGLLATEFGLNPKTVRYYEDIGLLTKARRTSSGYRIYGDREREQLAFILKARSMGLTLDEIGEILDLRKMGQQPCEHVLDVLDEKIEGIDAQLRVLQEFREELVSIKAEAAKNATSNACVCGIIERHDWPHPLDVSPLPVTPRFKRSRRR